MFANNNKASNTNQVLSASAYKVPNNTKKESGWETLRKKFQSKKKQKVQRDLVDNDYHSSSSLDSLYSEITSESSRNTSHSSDENFSVNSHLVPNNQKKESGWETLRKRFQSEKN